MMRFRECFGDRRNVLDRASQRQTFFQQLAQRLALHKLHHEERLARRRFAVVVNDSDVLVRERGNGARLANETRAVVMIGRSQELDGDAAREVLVLGQIDHAHAAFAQFFEDSIMGNCLADHAGGFQLTEAQVSFVARIFASCDSRNSWSFWRSSGRLLARIATANSAALIAPGLPMAKVPTGIPPGICTVPKSESRPFKASLFIGTPSTGRVVCAASTPARCAAPPAAAMMTSTPRSSAVEPNSAASEGERCAEITRDSCATPNCESVSSACFMVSQSDWLPMMTATNGFWS